MVVFDNWKFREILKGIVEKKELKVQEEQIKVANHRINDLEQKG